MVDVLFAPFFGPQTLDQAARYTEDHAHEVLALSLRPLEPLRNVGILATLKTMMSYHIAALAIATAKAIPVLTGDPLLFRQLRH